MTPKQFGQCIRKRRESKGVSLRKFSDMISVSPTYLSKVELGAEKPTSEMVQRIAALLDLHEDELMGQIGRVPPDVVEIILSDPRLWCDTIRTIAQQRARLERRLAGRKPADFSDCGIPHLVED